MEEIEIVMHLRLTLAAVRVVRVVLKRPLVALILLFSTLPVFAQTIGTADVIVVQENAFWKAYTAGNVTDLSALLRPDFTNVEREIWTSGQVLAFVEQFHKQCSLAPVALVDPHVSFLTPDIATIVYHANEAATCGARTMSGDTKISTVWVRRNGHWQMHLHTEYGGWPGSLATCSSTIVGAPRPDSGTWESDTVGASTSNLSFPYAAWTGPLSAVW